MSKLNNIKHQVPVMLNEVLHEFNNCLSKFNNQKDLIILDLTLGDGGHSYSILQVANKKISNFRLVSLDWDKSSITYVLKNYSALISRYIKCTIGCNSLKIKNIHFNEKWDVIYSNFLWIDKLFKYMDYSRASFVIADLGVSSRQLLAKNRGFSYKDSSVLDMRMAKEYQQVLGADILNAFSKKELRNLFVRTLGLSKDLSTYIANKIIRARQKKPFGAKDDIKRLNAIAFNLKAKNLGRFKNFRYNPTTLLLLALRVAVNSELENLFNIWIKLQNIVHKHACIVFIGFHSTEWEILETVPNLYNFELKEVIPVSFKEKISNNRARSAKMFIFRYNG